MQQTDEDLNDLPDWKKKTIKSKYYRSFGLNLVDADNAFADIDERLRDIEFKLAKKNSRETITRAQKMVLLHQIGALEPIMQLDISKAKQARLISLIIDEDADNIEGDLNIIDIPDCKLKIEKNYKYATSLFNELGLDKLSESTSKIVDKIIHKKESTGKKSK